MRRLRDPGFGLGCWRVHRRWGPQLDIESRKHSLRIVRDQTSAAETSGDVFRRHASRIRCAKCQEEFDLGDLIDVCSDERINFFAVSAPGRAEETEVKWLRYVGGMRGKADRDNIVVFTVRFKLDRLMASVSREH